MPVSISKLPEVTNVKDNSFMLITQDGTTKRTMCDQFVTEEEARLDEFSPTVITSKSMSKTGEGDNVDYSSSAYDAPMKDVVLKGKTLVNCIQEPSSQDVVLPYEFEEGQYVTINDTKETGVLGVELKGQTLVNLANYNSYRIESDNHLYIDLNFKSTSSIYTIINYSNKIIQFVDDNNTYIEQVLPNSTYLLNSSMFSKIKGNSGNGWIDNGEFKKAFIVLEGDYTNVDIPFFTGMQSVKMPILHTNGKNLCDNSKNFIGNINGVTGVFDELKASILSMPIKVNHKNYVGSRVVSSNSSVTFNQPTYRVYNSNMNYIGSSLSDLPETGGYVILRCIKSDGSLFLDNELSLIEFQLEENTRITQYEPHKSSILSTLEPVELGSVGDVQDTFDLLTGDLTKRVYKIVFDESFKDRSVTVDEFENVYRFGVNADHISNNLSNDYVMKSMCDKFSVDTNYTGDYEHSYYWGAKFYFFISKNKLQGTANSFKTYITDNPITFQTICAEPVHKTVDLKVVDQNGNVIPTLKSWNTTTHIYSEIPENSLYPILSHSNPTYPVILKPSTKYSIVTNSYSNDHTNSAINFNLGGATASTTVGNRVTTITTPSTLSNELLTMSGRGNKLNNVMVIEGDVAGDEPYFEGICDVKSPILSNCGKNLFDGKIELGGIGSNGIPYDSDVLQRSMNFTRVSPNTTYKISDTSAIDGFNIIEYDFNKNIIECNWIGNKPFTTKTNCHYIKWFNNKVDKERFAIIEQGSYPSPYEPYKSNILSFNQKDDKTIVLRSLPNGVCDTLNIETGEYVQRIGEVVINGVNSEYDHVDNTGLTNHTRYRFQKAGLNVKYIPVAQQSYNVEGLPNVATPWNSELEGVQADMTEGEGANWLWVRVANSRLSSPDKTGVLEWLSQNPITVQYELATPIVSTVDVQGFPYAYKDGHVQLSSSSIEQSLTPKVEYNIATNRGGQITQNTKSLIRQGKLLNDIESKINQIIEATVNDSIMLMKLRNK